MRPKSPTPENPVKVAVYARVSTDEQAKGNYSIAMQREHCIEALDHRFGKNLYVPVFFTDEGLSGTLGLYDPGNARKRHRPALQSMYEAFKAGQVTVLCVYRLSRLWRKAASGDFLCEHFVPNGLTEVISCHEKVDLNSANGRLNLNISSALSAYESDQLGEWISDAKQKRKRDGYPNAVPYGWRRQREEERDTSGRPGIARNDEEAAYVKQAAERYLAGDGIRAITAWLNTLQVPTRRRAGQWATGVVRRMIANPIHAGLIEVRLEDGTTELRQGKHYEQRIFDREVHEQIVARLARNHRLGGQQASRPEFLLAGLVACANCGGRLHGVTRRSHTRIYRCRDGMQSALEGCTRSQVDAVTLEGLVIAELRRLSVDAAVQEDAAEQAAHVLSSRAVAVDKEIEQLNLTMKKLWDNYDFWAGQLEGGLCERDEFERHRDRFREEKEKVQARLDELQALSMDAQARAKAAKTARALVADFDTCWESLTPEQRRDLVQTVIATASIRALDGGSREFRFAFHGCPEVVRTIQARKNPDRPAAGLESLWPTEQAALYWVGQGLSTEEIARRRGIKIDGIRVALHDARVKLDADTNEEAWQIAREHIEANIHSLPLEKRKRRKDETKTNKRLLTNAQSRLLLLMRDGMTAKQAAGELGIAENTVYVQLRNSRQALGAGTTEQAIKQAYELGYLRGNV